MPCAEVIDGAATLAFDGLQGRHMAFGQVNDMDIVADTRAIGSRVIIAEHA